MRFYHAATVFPPQQEPRLLAKAVNVAVEIIMFASEETAKGQEESERIGSCREDTAIFKVAIKVNGIVTDCCALRQMRTGGIQNKVVVNEINGQKSPEVTCPGLFKVIAILFL